MTTLFIADLHLSAERPDITDCFLRFMAEETQDIDALYVLGDLFEMWIGDDDNSEFLAPIKAAFKALTDSGTPCYFIHGNRDFLIGKRFSQETGVQLLPEHSVIDLYGKPAVVLHGDTLCTDDESYQAFRRKVHNPFIQRLFFCLPLAIRQRIGQKMRAKSQATNHHKSQELMDVNREAVIDLMQKHQVTTMIHGHTHRPDIHRIEDNNLSRQRIVLGDWYSQGSVLKIDESNLAQLITRP